MLRADADMLHMSVMDLVGVLHLLPASTVSYVHIHMTFSIIFVQPDH